MKLGLTIGTSTFFSKHRRLKYAVVLLIIAALVIAFFSDGVRRAWMRSQQTQSNSRIALLRTLDVPRQGTVKINRILLDNPIQGASQQHSQVRYQLASPTSVVEDTDIRGYLDGSVKYSFNQGTAYHMRVPTQWWVFIFANETTISARTISSGINNSDNLDTLP